MTRFNPQSGRRQVDLRRLMPVCMALADSDVERAANLCQAFADALEDWNGLEGTSEEFVGQPFP